MTPKVLKQMEEVADKAAPLEISPPETFWLDPEDFGIITWPMYQLLTPRERRGLVKYRKVNGR